MLLGSLSLWVLSRAVCPYQQCVYMLTNEKGWMHHYLHVLTKESSNNPSSEFTFYWPRRLLLSRLVVPNCPLGDSCISGMLCASTHYLKSLRAAPCTLPQLQILRSTSKHVVDLVRATAVILPTYLTLLGTVFQVEVLRHWYFWNGCLGTNYNATIFLL